MATSGYLIDVELLTDGIPAEPTYPFSVPSLRNLKKLEIAPDVTFLVGENGSGKSTLLEGIAVAAGLNPEGGSRNLTFSTRSTESDLHHHLRLGWSRRPKQSFFLRAETFLRSTYNIDSALRTVCVTPHFPSEFRAPVSDVTG